MANTRTQRLVDLFLDAKSMPPEQRAAYLDHACSDDPSLRRQVDIALRHDDDPDEGFLKPAPPDPLFEVLFTEKDVPDPLIARTIGAYTIKSIIARGGMGTVYLAEQDNPRRPVAVKIMQAGLWSGSAKRRFEYESHILGRLQHPNIAQVYEAGVAGPSPLEGEGQGEGANAKWSHPLQFFAMEYVPGGLPITEYADRHNLGIRERLELFLQACDGVHYGHQKGVIHRDLKPGNILVACEEPHPDPPLRKGRELAAMPQAAGPQAQAFVKLIDFGVARCTDSDIAVTTMHTDVGQLIGTLAYMSPEQCDGDPLAIDTRSDVYSLGVVLYELLCGKLPYELTTRSIPKSTRTICEAAPVKPSTIDRKLRGDLELLALKALEKDRDKRYPSVEALAGDIRRYLRGEPIEARRPTPWTRALKWAARRPKTTAAIGSLGIAAITLVATFVSVQIANYRPNRVELTQDGKARDDGRGRAIMAGDKVTVYSFSSRELHSWNASVGGGFTLAKLVERPSEWGGGRLIVLGSIVQNADFPFRGKLCAYNADGSYDVPVWDKTIEQDVIDEMPSDCWPRPEFEPDRQYRAGSFSVYKAWLLDIFPGPDHPGPEIVAYHQHNPGSQGALRIWNLNGEVLFHVWQDGGIGDVCWMPEAGLLVCIALKGDMDDAEYGWKLTRNHPHVIFAIRPKPGDISRGWIHPNPPGTKPRFKGDAWMGEWYMPVWYKLSCPVEWPAGRRYDAWFSDRNLLPPQYSAGDYAHLMIEFPSIMVTQQGLYNIEAIIDKLGVISKIKQGDPARLAYRADPSLPNPDDFKLLTWDSPDPPCGMK